MNETNKKNPVKEESPQITEGAAAGSSFSWRRLMAKKWAFPAMYMAAAAIILTFMWVYQDAGKRVLTEDQLGLGQNSETAQTAGKPETAPAGEAQETMQWPVADHSAMEKVLPYFDSKSSSETRQAAMLEYGDTFTPHVGIDLAQQDDQPFDVLAALGGKVTNVEKNPLVGNLVEITHPNGLVTVYQSLSEVKVAKDAEVKKGEVIAKAGRSELEKDQGTHLHFEVRQGQEGPSLNPDTFLTGH
jgi:stage II sporulation protein Q